MTQRFETVDDYIGSFPEDIQVVLAEVRQTIRNAAPGSEETISYQMPTITLDGKSLVHFAAWKHHIGLYPLPKEYPAIEQELAPYNTDKGTARFPLREPIPYDLIGRVTALLVEQRANPDLSL